jgi:hypothetical protein
MIYSCCKCYFCDAGVFAELDELLQDYLIRQANELLEIQKKENEELSRYLQLHIRERRRFFHDAGYDTMAVHDKAGIVFDNGKSVFTRLCKRVYVEDGLAIPRLR